MTNKLVARIFLVALICAPGVIARGSKCASCSRDKDGKIGRSKEAVRKFKGANPCPSTGKTSGDCPGYVIDHVDPLKRGGPDDSSNMQWQTIDAAKAKDKVE